VAVGSAIVVCGLPRGALRRRSRLLVGFPVRVTGVPEVALDLKFRRDPQRVKVVDIAAEGYHDGAHGFLPRESRPP
jgi:hypothetical protein